jgi:predicted nucleic acid-binding protein
VRHDAASAWREVLVAGNLVLSTQVLNELYVTVRPKLARPPDPDRASRAVADLSASPVRDLIARLVLAAIRRARESRLSYWDALIVETALDVGARVLLSADLQDGRDFGGLRVQNPFRTGEERTPLQ